VGIAKDAGHIVYSVTPEYPVLGADELYVLATPDGEPQLISDRADRVEFDGEVVYWLEYDQEQKQSVLKGARLAALGDVEEIATGLDPLTAHVAIVGTHLYVASKLGMWDYPAIAP